MMLVNYTPFSCMANDDAIPGPALEARQKLHERIKHAGAQGIGIGAYQRAFQDLENEVKNGSTEEKIRARVESIDKAVSEQLNRAKLLKTQRPVPSPTSSSGTARSVGSRQSDPEIKRLHDEMVNDPETMRRLRADPGNAKSLVMQKILGDPKMMKQITDDALRAQKNKK